MRHCPAFRNVACPSGVIVQTPGPDAGFTENTSGESEPPPRSALSTLAEVPASGRTTGSKLTVWVALPTPNPSETPT